MYDGLFNELLILNCYNNKTITSNLNCNQLYRLETALSKNGVFLVNRKEVILHLDNARPYTAEMTNDFSDEVDWNKLASPSMFSWSWFFW